MLSFIIGEEYEIIKKIYKYIFIFLLGCIVSGGIVYAAYSTDSTAVSYSPDGNDSQMKSVQDALDELYAKSENATSPNGQRIVWLESIDVTDYSRIYRYGYKWFNTFIICWKIKYSNKW